MQTELGVRRRGKREGEVAGRYRAVRSMNRVRTIRCFLGWMPRGGQGHDWSWSLRGRGTSLLFDLGAVRGSGVCPVSGLCNPSSAVTSTPYSVGCLQQKKTGFGSNDESHIIAAKEDQ